jgi:hypothetical protein
MQVDQGRAPGDLSEGVGHRDGGGLLEGQHVAEIVGEFLQEGGLFRGQGRYVKFILSGGVAP